MIRNISALAQTSPKSGKPTVVLANGVFDVFHIGHLRYLQAGRALGDVLVVSVTRDRNVGKGDGRPVFNEDERSAIIRALAIVDEVILSDDLLDAMIVIKPNIVVKGWEYRDSMRKCDLDWMNRHGVEMCFTKTMLASSTEIIERGFKRS